MSSDGSEENLSEASSACTHDENFVYYPTPSDLCTDNKIVFDTLVSYMAYGEKEFGPALVELRRGADENESEDSKDWRRILIENVIFEQDCYNEVRVQLKESVDEMQLDIRHAQSEWVQNFYLNVLDGYAWNERYEEQFECAELDFPLSLHDDHTVGDVNQSDRSMDPF
jgi:hypothetical protein